MYKAKNLKLRNKLLLIGIILLAFILRFWKLDQYPALNADEAAIGYNAYSLQETGKDEHGNNWPIHFQSFNDYKPGFYFYLVLPFVKFLGLNEWAVRIPGATLGVLSVLVMHFLIKELFNDGKSEIGNDGRTTSLRKLEILAPAFLAISPWHIHFSKGGWEVNTALFFMLLGLYLFFKGIKNLPLLMLSGVSFVFSLYTYHSARIVIPLLGLGLLIIYRKRIRENLKNFILAGVVMLVAVLPLVKDFTRTDVVSRAAGVGLFADTGPLTRINEQRGEHSDFQGKIPRVLHNKLVNYGLALLKNWTDHFHGEFLFLNGDPIQRNKVPETGQMYLFDLVFTVAGLIYIFRYYYQNTKSYSLIIWWLVIGPTAAALTFQSPHALRSQNMVIPLTFISALGLVYIIQLLRAQKKLILEIGNWLLFILVIWQIARYEHMYWVHMAKEYQFSSQYGLKELASFVKENQNKYEKIIITDRYDQPYILLLFYLRYSPEKFQQEHILSSRDKFGFSTVRNFDKFEFRQIVWDIDQPKNPNSLLIGTDQEVPNEANIIKEIYGTNGYKYFEVVAN